MVSGLKFAWVPISVEWAPHDTTDCRETTFASFLDALQTISSIQSNHTVPRHKGVPILKDAQE